MADQPSAPSPAATPQLETAQTETETPPAEASHDLLEANPELEEEEEFDEDADSALGNDNASSTNSLTSSIMEYRTIKGRTYHSEKHESKYFTPNDEQQMQSQDITHHYLSILLDDKLFLAPIKEDIEKVLDVGTGTGIWAIDMGDRYPNAEITGTDLSPTQPLWVPPNVKFEIDDCTKQWTWAPNSFDFIHMRYLFGAISDWNELLANAYRCCKPGGWVQSAEMDVFLNSDDGTLKEDSTIIKFWNPLWRGMTKKLGVSFQVLEDRSQNKGFEEAGFVDIEEVNYKVPIGGWARDPKLAEVGEYTLLALLNDLSGYTLLPWNVVHGEDTPGYHETLAHLRKEFKSKAIHGYMTLRFVYGRKPESA